MNAEYVAERTGLSAGYVHLLLHRGYIESFEEPEIALLLRAVNLRDRQGVSLKNAMALLREDPCPSCGRKR